MANVPSSSNTAFHEFMFAQIMCLALCSSDTQCTQNNINAMPGELTRLLSSRLHVTHFFCLPSTLRFCRAVLRDAIVGLGCSEAAWLRESSHMYGGWRPVHATVRWDIMETSTAQTSAGLSDLATTANQKLIAAHLDPSPSFCTQYRRPESQKCDVILLQLLECSHKASFPAHFFWVAVGHVAVRCRWKERIVPCVREESRNSKIP